MAMLAEAVDRLVEGGVKPVMRMLLVDMATRGEVVCEGLHVVGYWVGKQIRIDVREKKKAGV